MAVSLADSSSVLMLARRLDKNVSTFEELFCDLKGLPAVKREKVVKHTVYTSKHYRSIYKSDRPGCLSLVISVSSTSTPACTQTPCLGTA